ncbi:hypothetical protein quinque_015210 [Culex quinquefasciatus]
MITNAVTGSAHFPQNVNTSGHGDCEPDLRVIVRSLAEIHNETAQIKAGGRTTEEVQELKDNFEQEVEQLAKERDVFELDFKREVLKREGEMYGRIHELKKSIQDLKQRVREAEEEFYELAFELVGIRVETNSMDGKEECYGGMIPKGRFGAFFKHVVANHGYGTLLDAMNLLQRIYDPKDIFYEFLEEFIENPSSAQIENHKMALTFICWATKQEGRNFVSDCKLYHLYKMTTQFFPTSNDGLQAVSNAFPIRSESKRTCNVEKAFFDHLKKAILDVIKSKEEISLETAGNFGDCQEDLHEIVSTLKQIHAETTLVRKEGGSIEDIEELKEVFQAKMADFVREQDIFRKDFDANQLKVKGKLYDKVHKLRVEIRDLEEEIRKTEEDCRLLLQKSRSKGLVFPSIREVKLAGANPIGGGKQQVAGRAWPMLEERESSQPQPPQNRLEAVGARPRSVVG